MTEFAQTMKDWHRMCKAMIDKCPHDACSDCPLGAYGCSAVYEGLDTYKDVDFEVVGERIAEWAAEHKEQVYPTWLEWLKSMGVVPYMMGLVVTRGADDGHFHDGHVNITAKALEAIPIDIAEKLGIEPKEG